jgi:hypothetical protein
MAKLQKREPDEAAAMAANQPPGLEAIEQRIDELIDASKAAEALPLVQLHDGAWLQSARVGKLMAALASAAAEYPPIPQNGKMSRGSGSGKREYTYAKIGDLVNATRPVLAKHGVVHAQTIIEIVTGDRVTHFLINRLAHGESEQFIETRTSIPYSKNPQDLGSTITYFRRYTTQCLLNLAPDEDDDGSSAAMANALQNRIDQLEQEKLRGTALVRQLEAANHASMDKLRRLEAQIAQAEPAQRRTPAQANGQQGTQGKAATKPKAKRSAKVKPLPLDGLTDALNELNLTAGQVDWLRQLLGKGKLNDAEMNDSHRAASVRKIAESPTAVEYYQNALSGLSDIEAGDQLRQLFMHMHNVIAGNYQKLQKSGPVPAGAVSCFDQALELEKTQAYDQKAFDALCAINDIIADALERPA